ncbi:uncharacterized protein [Antedon mediterranea]|uniref:uncharacterized protein n=1 Tax=Antedon mediterranea TaxID=105859 RepID=UPI003AF920C6
MDMTDENTSGVVSSDTCSHITTSSCLAKLEDWEEDVLNIIISCKAVGATSVDLAGKGMIYFPEELLELDKIEVLYLEGNKLTELPSTLFESLPNLRWLDLRNNQLQELPPSIGEHKHLKTLLIEGNQISMLPVELGFLKTLSGLNLRNNPLEFPPKEVTDQGVNSILRFLREISVCQQRSSKVSIEDLKLENLRIQEGGGESSTDSDNFVSISNQERWSHRMRRTGSRQSLQSSMSNLSDVEGPSSATMSLHKHISYNEYRQKQYQKFKRAGALGISGKDKRKRRKKKTPPKPKINPMQAKIQEELRNDQLRTHNLQQSVVEQRLKDTKLLQDWRDETRTLQRKHYIRAIRNNALDDFTDPSVKAPYDTDPDYMKIISKEERIKVEVKNRHEAMMNRMRPETRRRMEAAARLDRDRHLLEKIKEHTKRIQERNQQPKGRPQEILEATKKDLEMAKTLHLEVNSRQKELEYRFKAFTGDASHSPAFPNRF